MPDMPSAMFRVCLVRHARASWGTPGVADFDRPLDDRGRDEARGIAQQALVAGLRPDMLVTSPALRARQTAAALAEHFGNIRPIEDMQLYAGGPESYIAQIARYRGKVRSIMLVGHNPMVEALSHYLCRPSALIAPLDMGYPTAGLLAVDFPQPLPRNLEHAGDAIHLITPPLI